MFFEYLCGKCDMGHNCQETTKNVYWRQLWPSDYENEIFIIIRLLDCDLWSQVVNLNIHTCIIYISNVYIFCSFGLCYLHLCTITGSTCKPILYSIKNVI